MEVIDLDPKRCAKWAFANRSTFEFGNISSLAHDIQVNGQIQPVLARPVDEVEVDYEIIAGARRWRACLEIEHPLKAIVQEISDLEAFHRQHKENDKLPFSDYSTGMHLSKMLTAEKITLAEAASFMGCSKTKITNLLTFGKVPTRIWSAVEDMSKVSSRCSEIIFRLSNKGDEWIDALVDVAEEIRKGAGANKIEKLVNTAVLGEHVELEHRKKIVSEDGKIIGCWTKNGLQFEKGLSINQEKVEEAILGALTAFG